MTTDLVYFVFLGIFILQFILILILGGVYSEKERNEEGDLMEVSVIIPFRNEEYRLATLLASLNDLILPKKMKVEFIFVNDHSNDDSVKRIDSDLKQPFSIVDSGGFGKKEAIKTGVKLAKYEKVICWDADVAVPINYFPEIAQLSEADMWILPVEMTASSLIGKWGKIEFDWLQMLTYVMAKWQSPVLCNGANLLFSRKAFLATEQLRTDDHIASGDDLFLLEAFKEQGYTIKATKKESLRVKTQALGNLTDLLRQRKRWAGKMRHLWNFQFSILLFLLVFFTFSAPLCAVYASMKGSVIYMAPILLKIFGEILLLRYYRGFDSDSLDDFKFVWIHALTYPLFLLAIPFISGDEERWDQDA